MSEQIDVTLVTTPQHIDVAINTVDQTITVTLVEQPQHIDVTLIDVGAYASTVFDHILGTGADHTYINQDVTAGSSPTFDGANFTGIDAVNVDLTDAGNLFVTDNVEAAMAEIMGDLDAAELTIVAHTAAIALNTTHRGSNGSDHTFIDQDVTSGSSPNFDGAYITGVDAANVDIADVGALFSALNVEAALAENRTAINLNTTHRTSDGKNHSDVVLNNTHRAGDGTDHSEVAACKVITDFISVTQAVDLDDIETNSNASKVITDFLTVTQAVDLDTMETDVAASKTITDWITVTQAVDLDSMETRIANLDAAVVLTGTFDPSGGVFPGGGTAQAGESYISTGAGTIDGMVININDRVIAVTDNAGVGTAAHWHLADYTDQVLSVAGQTGAITLTDIGLGTTDVPVFEGVAVDYVGLTINPTGVPSTEGTLFHDPVTHMPAYKSDIADSTINIGLEDWTRIHNETGAILPNGTLITGSSAHEHEFDVIKAIATPGGVANLGMVTSDIGIAEEGWAVTRGHVHDLALDVATYSLMDPLYLSGSVSGAFTNVAPSPPNYTIPIGFVTALESVPGAEDGTAYIYLDNPLALINHTNAAVASKDPTGFHFPSAIQVDYDSTTRKVTLTGDLTYSYRGQVKSLTSPWTSPTAHDTTLDKLYFLASTDGENFVWTDAVWDFYDNQMAAIYYGTSDKFGLVETHGLMNWQAHEEFHTVIGTYKQSGGTLDSVTPSYVLASTTAADRRPDVVETIVKDEDILTTNAALTSNLYTRARLDGAGGAVVFDADDTDIVNLSTNQPYWNEWTGATWQETLMTNNSYMCVWLVAVPATNDAGSQKYRYFWYTGQSNSTVLADEQALFPQDLSLGIFDSLFTEFVFCVKVIVRYTAGNWQLQEVQNLTGTRVTTTGSASGVYLSTVTSDATLSGTGTPTDPLVVATEKVPNQTIGGGVGSVGLAYYLTSTADTWLVADKDTEAEIAGEVGICLEDNTIVFNGLIPSVAHGLGATGAALYIGAAGALTTTATTTTGEFVRRVGFIEDVDNIRVDIDSNYYEIGDTPLMELADFTDAAKEESSKIVQLGSVTGASLEIDWSAGSVQIATLTEITNITFINWDSLAGNVSTSAASGTLILNASDTYTPTWSALLETEADVDLTADAVAGHPIVLTFLNVNGDDVSSYGGWVVSKETALI